ncbi:MAG: questin oxidase family protein [Thainema sp.]
MDIGQHCRSLIQQASSFHPLYGDRLANHLPMVLIAMQQMGADDTALTQYYHAYISKLQVVNSEKSRFIQDFVATEHLGNRDRFNDFSTFFHQEIAKSGKSAVLQEWLPLLMPGVAASAFHALIRLAYAVEADLDSEIAIALAYWAAEFQPLGSVGQTTSESIIDIAVRLGPIGAEHQFQPGIIVDRMNEIKELSTFQSAIYQPEQLCLDDIRQLCIAAYLQTGDFTLLHAVTSTHAFRVILPYQSNPELALRYHWQAILVAYLSTGLLLNPDNQDAPTHQQDWSSCFTNAIASRNDHQIKLTYTCWREFEQSHAAQYLRAAHQVNHR